MLAALGHAPFNFLPATLAGLFLAGMLLASVPSWRRGARLGWIVGTAYFAVTLIWIVEPFLVDIARHGWMAPFALAFMAGGLALFWALGFGLARWLSAGWAPVLLALTLPLAELGRTYLFTGFPWALVAYPWLDWGGIHWVSVIGSHGLSVLTLLAIGSLALGLTRRSKRLGAPGVLILMGLMLLAPTQEVPEPDGPTIRLIQPNAPQHLKWRPDMVWVFFERQLALTEELAEDPDLAPPSLHVWPEVSVPRHLDQAERLLAEIAEASGDVPVVVGAQRRDAGGTYNSLAVVGPGGRIDGLYDKHHLVPFGEYIPGGRLISRTGIGGLATAGTAGYVPGPGPQLLDFGPLGRALPLICYEAIFPQDIHAAPERPDWLLQITNDAWFGTFSGPYQHLAQARIRAIEQGLPMVRVANTGVSAMIDANGETTARLPLGVAGHVDARLPAAAPPTLYSRTGDSPLAILLIVLTATLSVRRFLMRD